MWPFTRTPAPPVDPAEGHPTTRALHDALARHDWAHAEKVLRAVTDADDRAYHLARIEQLPDLWGPLGEWVAGAPGDPLPLTVRGAYGIGWAWQARTAARAKYVSREQFQEFFRRLALAEDALDEAIRIDEDEVTARAYLVLSARGRQVSPDEAKGRFTAVVRRHRHHVFAHQHRLQYLCHKWFGSDAAMFAFARSTASHAPDGSLLGALVPDAHVEASLDGGGDYWADPAVREELHAAADRSVFHPAYEPRVSSVWALNLFAFAFSMTGDRPAAARCFGMLGDRVTEYPWTYDTVFAAPGKAYARHRAKAASIESHPSSG